MPAWLFRNGAVISDRPIMYKGEYQEGDIQLFHVELGTKSSTGVQRIDDKQLFHPVEPEDWPDFIKLFLLIVGESGG